MDLNTIGSGFIGGLCIAAAGYIKNYGKENIDIQKAGITVLLGGFFGLLFALTGQSYTNIEDIAVFSYITYLTQNITKTVTR